MNIVRLRNGAEEAEVAVKATMPSLKELADSNPVALYELLMKAQDRNHSLFGNTGDILRDAGLLESNGRVHDTVRNIVLSAVSIDGNDIRLVWPVA